MSLVTITRMRALGRPACVIQNIHLLHKLYLDSKEMDLPAGNRRVKVQFVPQQGSVETLPGGEEYLDLEKIENRNPTHRGRLKSSKEWEQECTEEGSKPSAATKPSVSFQESLGAEGSAVLIATSNSSVQSGTLEIQY